jgi:hypothetical protein
LSIYKTGLKVFASGAIWVLLDPGGSWEGMSFFPNLQSEGTDRRGTGRKIRHKLTLWPKYLPVENIGA